MEKTYLRTLRYDVISGQLCPTDVTYAPDSASSSAVELFVRISMAVCYALGHWHTTVGGGPSTPGETRAHVDHVDGFPFRSEYARVPWRNEGGGVAWPTPAVASCACRFSLIAKTHPCSGAVPTSVVDSLYLLYNNNNNNNNTFSQGNELQSKIICPVHLVSEGRKSIHLIPSVIIQDTVLLLFKFWMR